MSEIKCPYSKKCGGCQLQNLSYERQLSFKQVKAIKLLGKYCHVDEIIGMKNPYHYRNKVQAAFFTRGKEILSGVYQSSTKSVTAVESCLIEDKLADEIILTIRKLLKSFKLRPFNADENKGFLRHVLVKRSNKTNQTMVVLVTATEEFKPKEKFVNALLNRHPEITTVVQNVNDDYNGLMLGEKSKILYGDGYIEDILCGCKFRISPKAFYQINPTQTEVLYDKALEFACLSGEEILLDAYCGTGTIGIIAAQKAKRVVGVEINADAVKDALVNAKINNTKNIEFYEADAGDFMVEAAAMGEKFDMVIMDPPRAGASLDFLKSLVKLSPEKVVYVSCNPKTLARDLSFLTRKCYKVTKIQPVDMFPHTEHVEAVVLLRRQMGLHKMKLNPVPFEMIKSGEKTIELRLFDEKRQQVKIGDKIVFTNTANGEALNTTVVKLHRFNSFKELYKSLPLLRCGYKEENINKATPSDMEQYYSLEQQKKYGVIGIELCLNKN